MTATSAVMAATVQPRGEMVRVNAATKAGSHAGDRRQPHAPNGSDPVPLQQAVVETGLGGVRVVWRGDTLVALTLLGGPARAADEPGARGPLAGAQAPAAIHERLRAIIDGRSSEIGPVNLDGLTPLQRNVLGVVAAIPRGQVRPYGWVADMVGHPGAARAVGCALASNPVPLVIPCHRVVCASGEIGAYSGGGPGTKERILRYEGVDVQRLQALAKRGTRFVGHPGTRTFCWPTCSQVAPGDPIPFRSAGEARRGGFAPCPLCHPPGADTTVGGRGPARQRT